MQVSKSICKAGEFLDQLFGRSARHQMAFWMIGNKILQIKICVWEKDIQCIAMGDRTQAWQDSLVIEKEISKFCQSIHLTPNGIGCFAQGAGLTNNRRFLSFVFL